MVHHFVFNLKGLIVFDVVVVKHFIHYLIELVFVSDTGDPRQLFVFDALRPRSSQVYSVLRFSNDIRLEGTLSLDLKRWRLHFQRSLVHSISFLLFLYFLIDFDYRHHKCLVPVVIRVRCLAVVFQ